MYPKGALFMIENRIIFLKNILENANDFPKNKNTLIQVFFYFLHEHFIFLDPMLFYLDSTN